MQFSSGPFLMLFLPITMLVYFNPLVKGRKFRNICLLVASLFFYFWGEPLFGFILCGSIGINWFWGKKIGETEVNKKKLRKKYLILSLILNLGILFIFKYLTFSMKNVAVFWDVEVIDIALPIGISFYTFQIMSYIFDVYYQKVKYQEKIYKLALYILMFPQMIAGPIVRYKTVVNEIDNRAESIADFEKGVRRFVIGLEKKVLLADFLGQAADYIFSAAKITEISVVAAWIGALTYTLEIYYDFSGYSDMAIGLGRCFGFHFEDNFNYPYISKSITEFWRRWHISLTNWFRDYVYIPLGGNRVSCVRHIINLLIIWILTGIWHGANWTFLLWGIIYWCFQVLEKYLPVHDRLPVWGRHIYTLLIVILNWVIFKSESVSLAFKYIAAMFGGTSIFIDADAKLYIESCAILLFVAGLGCIPWKQMLEKYKPELLRNAGMTFLVHCMYMVLFLIAIMTIINGSYSPFIYFNF